MTAMESPDLLFRQCCADAAGSVTEMATRVATVAASFRGSDMQAANASLVHLAGDLQIFVTFLHTLSKLPDAEQHRFATAGVNVGEHLQQFGGWLASMVSAQEADDWGTVSDVLEHDLWPVISAWSTALHRCAGGAEVSPQEPLGPDGRSARGERPAMSLVRSTADTPE